MNLPEGCVLIEHPIHFDERGSFQRLIDVTPILGHASLRQISISKNLNKHTLRGMHYQKSISTEYKFVTCTRGSVFDVVVDLRPSSHTYLMTSHLTMSCLDGKSLLLAPGIAHGFLTLEPETEIVYGMTAEFSVEDYAGFNYADDLILDLWPEPPKVISKNDSNLPFLTIR